MLLFIHAFYAIHAVIMQVVLVSNSPSHSPLSNQCALCVEFGWRLLEIAAALIAMHLLGTLPNLLKNHLLISSSSISSNAAVESNSQVRTGATTRRIPSSAAKQPPVASSQSALLVHCCDPSISVGRRALLTLYALVHLGHQLVWIGLLAWHLQVNWTTYRAIDAHLTAAAAARSLPGTTAALLDPMESARNELPAPSSSPPMSGPLPPHGEMCGSIRSIHLLRWSLVCLCVTTALVLSLGIVVVQEALAGGKAIAAELRAARRARRAARATQISSPQGTAAASAAPAAAVESKEEASDWLDMQTDEVEIDLSGDEEDPPPKL